MFLRKHSAVIKKNLLLEAINYRLRKQESEGKPSKSNETMMGASQAEDKSEASMKSLHV